MQTSIIYAPFISIIKLYQQRDNYQSIIQFYALAICKSDIVLVYSKV